ncbi:hypothetical protein J6U78_03600 [bacterium]|nr:hypothetical protein [bacterium]
MITAQQWINALERDKQKYVYVIEVKCKCSENIVGKFLVVEKYPIKNCHYIIEGAGSFNSCIQIKDRKHGREYAFDEACFFSEDEAKLVAAYDEAKMKV